MFLDKKQKNFMFFLDQMYRNLNKRDTNEDQILEKHSEKREPDGHTPNPIPKTEKPKNDPGTQPGIDTDNATRRH